MYRAIYLRYIIPCFTRIICTLYLSVVDLLRILLGIAAQPVQQQLNHDNCNIYDENQDGGEGRSHTKLVVFHLVQDQDRQETVVGGYQEDDRADGGHAADEGVDQAAEEGALDEGQGHRGEDPAGVGAKVCRRFLDTGVDLLEAAFTGPDADGQGPDHESRNEDGRRTGKLDGRLIKGQDVADTDNGARYCDTQQGREVDEAPADKFLPHYQIGDDHAQDTGNRRCDDAQQGGILDGILAHIQCVLVMSSGETVVDAPHLNEGGHRNQDIDGQHDSGDQEAEAPYQTYDLGIVDHGPFPGCLACYGNVSLLFDPVLGQDEQDNSNVQQHYRHRGAALYIVAADGLEVNLGGQGGEVAADGHGVGKVGYRFNKHQQEGVGDTGPHQRDGHRGEGAPLGRTQVPGRVLNAGVDGLKHACQQQESDGKIGNGLYEDQAFQPVDVGVAPA